MTRVQDAHKQALIAEQEAKRAEHHAETARALAGRNRVHIKALTHKVSVAAENLNTSSQRAGAEFEARAKYQTAKALLAEKQSLAKQLQAEAKNFKSIASSKKAEAKAAKTAQEKAAVNTKAQEAETKAAEKEAEAKKTMIEVRQASTEAKKAQLETEDAAVAKASVLKHTKTLAEAEAELKMITTEFEMREAEAKARSAQAQAKMAEAKAIRRGATKEAEVHRAAAKLNQAQAIDKAAEIQAFKKAAKTLASGVRKVESEPKAPIDASPKRQARQEEKKYLSAKGLLSTVCETFQEIPEPNNKQTKSGITICDCLMSGLAVFSLKYPSLLQFNQDAREDDCLKHNLKTLYLVDHTPSDTYMRERLDEVDPTYLRPAYKKLFANLQRGKVLEEYLFLDEYYLMAGDGTGFFSSDKIHCDECCTKCHKDGHCTYYHQMMCAAIVHPDRSTVIPLCPEPISNQDGSDKNDCERNASERLYRHIRREHPHLPLIVTEDALGANGPHIRLLQKLDMRYILVAKPENNKSLFEFLRGIKFNEYNFTKDGFEYKIRFINGVPLNETHNELMVNFIELCVYDKDNNIKYHNSWITDLLITNNNAYRLCQGGRAKWKIENETFNTLKNQGYNFEHNYGHGFKHLSTVFACLMMLAFFIDQIQQSSCGLFQMALAKMGSKVRLWGRMRAYFTTLYIDSWEKFFQGIALGIKEGRLIPEIQIIDTS